MSNRRAFLKFVAGSPLFSTVPAIAQALAQNPIDKAADALDVFDFEADMVESLLHISVGLRVARTNQQMDGAIGQAKLSVVFRKSFLWPQFKNLLIEFGNHGRLGSPDRDMI